MKMRNNPFFPLLTTKRGRNAVIRLEKMANIEILGPGELQRKE
jgi:hypothetical protein